MKHKSNNILNVFFLLLIFNFAFSQNNSELVNRIRYIQFNDSVVNYSVEGYIFQKHSCLTDEDFRNTKKIFAKYLNKKKYSLSDSRAIISLKNNNITKIIYENPSKSNCVFYDYTNSNNSKNSISFINYKDYPSLKFDSIAKYIIDEQISSESKINAYKDFVDFDGIKLKVDSTKSLHDNYAHAIQSISGYQYSFYYFKSKFEVEKFIKSEVKHLSSRLPKFNKTEFDVEINQNEYIVKQVFGNHLYGNKKEGYQTIYDNFLISYAKKGDKYLFIKAYRGKIYDEKEVKLTDEFTDILRQISLSKL